MSLQKLKKEIAHRTSTFSLQYTSKIHWISEQKPVRCIVKSKMTDPHHEIDLYISVSLADLRIDDLAFEFIRVPFPECIHSFPKYQEFIGEDMSEKKIKGRLKDFSSRQCLHLNELFEVTVKAFISGYAFFLKDKEFPSELDEYKMHIGSMPLLERVELTRLWWMKDARVRDSCHAYRMESAHDRYAEQLKKIDTISKMMITEIKKNSGK